MGLVLTSIGSQSTKTLLDRGYYILYLALVIIFIVMETQNNLLLAIRAPRVKNVLWEIKISVGSQPNKVSL